MLSALDRQSFEFGIVHCFIYDPTLKQAMTGLDTATNDLQP